MEKLIASTLDEIGKIIANGPPQVNLDKFKVEQQRTVELHLKSNVFWLGYINGQLQNKEALDQVTQYNDALNKITTADVKAMAGKYLNGKNFIRLVLMPETSKP